MKSMTKEEIITGLKAAVKPEEEYFIEDDLIDAIRDALAHIYPHIEI